MSDTTAITFEDGVLDRVRQIVSVPGWTAEPATVMYRGNAAVRLLAAPPGRGKKRASYLIVADTLPDAFRALSLCLAAIEGAA